MTGSIVNQYGYPWGEKKKYLRLMRGRLIEKGFLARTTIINKRLGLYALFPPLVDYVNNIKALIK